MTAPEPELARLAGRTGRETPRSSAIRAARSVWRDRRAWSPAGSHLPWDAGEEARALTPDAAGESLDPVLRAGFGERFGFDFSQVRIHSGTVAGRLADAAGARAYTVGSHIVFGKGQFAPASSAGRGLIAHELGHVVEQAKADVVAVQRDDPTNPAPKPVAAAKPDPETVLGTRLVKDFASGIAVAFYAPMPYDKEAAEKAAKDWAGREMALAVKGNAVTAANAVFGDAMSEDKHALVATLKAMATMLKSAVAKAPPDPAGPMPPGAGPTTVRTLAVFAHGTTNWCGLGSITSAKAASIIKDIAPTLAPNVNVILYSCNAGRNPDDSEEWVKGTMRPGGAKSLAAATRDALIAEGKGGSVWGHTTTGHVTTNFALREFDTTSGKGSEGASFVARYVFTGGDKVVLATELLDAVIAQGYELTSPNASVTADALVEAEMYRGYAAANDDLTFAGGKLAESAPVHPVEIGKQIKEYWTKTHWPARKSKAVAALIKRLVGSNQARKAKTPAPAVTPAPVPTTPTPTPTKP